MGSFKSYGKMMKNAADPFHLLSNKDEPVTWKSVVAGAHAAFDPISANAGREIAKHNNTEDNFRGYMDPGQLFGANSTTAAPYDPSGYKLNGGTGYDPSIGAPTNGISTDGLNNTGFTNGLNNTGYTDAFSQMAAQPAAPPSAAVAPTGNTEVAQQLVQMLRGGQKGINRRF